MRHTETNAYDVRRLLHVKGKKRVIAAEVGRVARKVTGCQWAEEGRHLLVCFRWR